MHRVTSAIFNARSGRRPRFASFPRSPALPEPSLQFRRSEQASDADSEANVFEASLGFFFFEIFVAVWWWKGILKPGNLQITSIPQRSEACFAFRLINSAFSALVLTVYSQTEPIITRYQSKNGTNVSCGSFAKPCGGQSLEMKRCF